MSVRFHARKWSLVIVCAVFALAGLACAQGSSPNVIYVTATFSGAGATDEPIQNPFMPTLTATGPTPTPIQPTPNAPRQSTRRNVAYTVKAGDSLAAIAANAGTTLEEILQLNPTLTTSTILATGQNVTIPNIPTLLTPNFKIIPDSELVNSPGARGFDVSQYVKFQPGFLRAYSEVVQGRLYSGTQIIQIVAQQNSVNPRILLALLEYRSGWVTNPMPTGNKLDYPLGWVNPAKRGLFSQLAWTADWLNDGYYGWKQRGLASVAFADNFKLAFAGDLNAGTVALQYFLGQGADRATWSRDVSAQGVFGVYLTLFGDPFRYAIEPLIPANLTQPEMTLPWAAGETWYYTGGPHGGWDAASGWAGIDFAPPRPPDTLIQQQGFCYISPIYARAMMAGLVVRSGDGVIVLDSDLDGDERTGWVLTYLHMSSDGIIPAGKQVQAGDPLGKPSCEGFNLSAAATHVHIARRYNGEWIAADCWSCPSDVPAPSWVMGGWTVKGRPGDIYQGTLVRGSETKYAEAGRGGVDNEVPREP